MLEDELTVSQHTTLTGTPGGNVKDKQLPRASEGLGDVEAVERKRRVLGRGQPARRSWAGRP